MSGPHHVTPDGTIWFAGPAVPQPQTDLPRDTLSVNDILGVRGITRVSPPYEGEDWIVVTFAVQDRLGDEVGEYTRVDLNGRILALTAPVIPDDPAPTPAPAVAEENPDAQDA